MNFKELLTTEEDTKNEIYTNVLCEGCGFYNSRSYQ